MRNFRTCTIEPQNDESGTCVMLDHTGNGSGRLKYDGDDKTDVRTLRCAIIGREKKVPTIRERRYYILVVTPVSSGLGSNTFPAAQTLSRLRFSRLIPRLRGTFERFERVGVGSISERFIQFPSAVDARIV